MCASVARKTSRPAGTVTNVQVWHLVPPLRERGSLAYPAVSFTEEVARYFPAFPRSRLGGGANLLLTHHAEVLEGDEVCVCRGENFQGLWAQRPTSRCCIRHRRLEYAGSLAYLAVSFAALLARRLSCICAVFTGRRHEPAAYTSYPNVREGHEVCICGGEKFKACGHRDQRPGAASGAAA
ncbi:hypothetical protein MRX96_010102 [Rhipicephalus microplus]